LPPHLTKILQDYKRIYSKKTIFQAFSGSFAYVIAIHFLNLINYISYELYVKRKYIDKQFQKDIIEKENINRKY